MVNTVDEIQAKPFFSRPPNEQLRILLEGKPRPQLNKLQFLDPKLSPPGTVMWINFDVSKYDQIDWLTGCERRQALFCWPCLLFNYRPNMWNSCGVKEQKISSAIEQHEAYVQHIQAMFDMQVYLCKNSVGNSISNTLFNELVKRNRDILKRVIDVVYLLITQKQPPRIGSRDKNQLKIEDCLETLQFLRDYDSLGDNIIEDALDLLQISPNVMTDLIEAITGLVKTAVIKEVQLSTFVSIILSVHGTNDTKSQLSTVLRYLKNGVVCERFIGFQYLDGKNFRTSMEILFHLDNVVSDFQIQQRLVSVAFDGGLPISKIIMDQLLRELPSHFPYVTFVPCYFHKLHYVLQQSVSMWNNCDCFFKTLKEIGHFFQNSTRKAEFESFMTKKRYPVKSFDFASSSDSLIYLKYSRKHFIDFLNSTKIFSADDFAKVQGYCQFLCDMKTIFFIDLFIRLFSVTGDLNEVLYSENMENVYQNDTISELLGSLDYEKKGGFKSLWKDFIGNRENGIRQDGWMDEDFYRALYLDIVECVQHQIRIRTRHLKTFEFFHLLNPLKISKYDNYDILTSKLSTFYGSAFQMPLLAKEADLLYKAFFGHISDKSLEQILEFFMEKKNGFVFNNLKKLAELILTIPYKPPSSSDSCILDKINSWSCPGKIAGDISLLCIEQNIFLELTKKNSFHDEVIIKFQENNQTLDMLDYKC